MKKILATTVILLATSTSAFAEYCIGTDANSRQYTFDIDVTSPLPSPGSHEQAFATLADITNKKELGYLGGEAVIDYYIFGDEYKPATRVANGWSRGDEYMVKYDSNGYRIVIKFEKDTSFKWDVYAFNNDQINIFQSQFTITGTCYGSKAEWEEIRAQRLAESCAIAREAGIETDLCK